MTIYKGNLSAAPAQGVPAFSATQMNQREVWDKIVLNYARDAMLIAMIANGEIGEDGISEGPGLIAKHVVNQIRFESYNYNPPEMETIATAALSSTTLYCDTANLKEADTLFNTENETSARVDSITSASECVITSFGATAFSVTAGDVLMINATAYGPNSANPSILTKDMDNVYNTLQISREPVAASNSMLKSQFHATNDYFKLLKKLNFINFLSKIERTWLFGERASGTGNTTAGGSTRSDAFYTTRGAYNWAANRYDMKGNISMFKIRSEIPQMLDTVSSSTKVIMLLGQGSLGRINELMNGQAMYTISGEESKLKKFGISTRVLKTNNMDIELIPHKAFDKGGMQKKALLMVPDNHAFVHLKDRDIRPVLAIQENDRDGIIDSVECEAGCRVLDGGQSSCVVENMW